MTRFSTEELEDLYENAPCGYLSLHPDGPIDRVNAIFLTWTGHRREELLGRRFPDLLNVAGKIYFETHFAPLLRLQGFFNEVALDLVAKDSTRIPVLINALERRDSDGNPTSIRITVFNATDRRLYERELLDARNALVTANVRLNAVNEQLTATNLQLDRANRELRAFYESLSVGIFRADGNGRIVQASLRFCTLVGVDTADQWLMGLESEDSMATAAQWHDAIRDNAPFSTRFQVAGDDDASRCIEMKAVPITGSEGGATAYVGTVEDVTEEVRIEAQKRQTQIARDAAVTEQQLQVNEERFRLVAKAAGNAIWERYVAEKTTWFNDGMKEIFGHDLRPDQVWYDVWLASIHPEDAPRVLAADKQLLSIGKPMYEQYRFRCADGRWATVEERAFAVKDHDGRAVRFMGSMTDISERVQLENRLRQAQKMESVGQLTGGLAHDFNNLLTVVMGNAELLSDALVDRPHLQNLANMTLAAADRGAEMTSRLLAFSRQQALQPRVIDLSQLVQGIQGLLRQTLPENIDIKFFRGGDLWNAEIDPGQLESALLNLALNARDAMPEGGSLTIETANCTLDDFNPSQGLDLKAGQYVMLAVTDTGHGISKDEIGRVFEPFFTTKEVGKGSGLGLSMVYGFVKQSAGHIQVYSEHGEGTVFKLYFPRSMGKEEQEQVNGSSKKILGGHEVVLVVEDDSMVREHVVMQLNSMGYRLIEAATGSEAVEILKQGTEIDLLFTDVVMPDGMSGPALADAARAMKPEIKVLFTSGYTENALLHNGRIDPNVQLLGKPYRHEQLALKVRQALSGS